MLSPSLPSSGRAYARIRFAALFAATAGALSACGDASPVTGPHESELAKRRPEASLAERLAVIRKIPANALTRSGQSFMAVYNSDGSLKSIRQLKRSRKETGARQSLSPSTSLRSPGPNGLRLLRAAAANGGYEEHGLIDAGYGDDGAYYETYRDIWVDDWEQVTNTSPPGGIGQSGSPPMY
jgi:hypothetical protein